MRSVAFAPCRSCRFGSRRFCRSGSCRFGSRRDRRLRRACYARRPRCLAALAALSAYAVHAVRLTCRARCVHAVLVVASSHSQFPSHLVCGACHFDACSSSCLPVLLPTVPADLVAPVDLVAPMPAALVFRFCTLGPLVYEPLQPGFWSWMPAISQNATFSFRKGLPSRTKRVTVPV